jgi:hypothetical protein
MIIKNSECQGKRKKLQLFIGSLNPLHFIIRRSRRTQPLAFAFAGKSHGVISPHKASVFPSIVRYKSFFRLFVRFFKAHLKMTPDV